MQSAEQREEPKPGAAPLRRILVVDDSRAQRHVLASTLRKWGYEVTEAGSGAEALEKCYQQAPELVISDWMMPEMNGLEFLAEFRAMERESYGYFILLTSKSEKTEIAAGLDAGADDFLTKPVNASELRARLKAGERIVNMERELVKKTDMISRTLAELRTLYDSLDNDLLEAKKLQQSLVRDRVRDLGTAQLSLLLRSSGHVGGDLVGAYPINERRVGLYSIDVSGHGISSALMTARLAGFLSSSAPEQNIALLQAETGEIIPRPPHEAVADLNRMILKEVETEHYFTMILADFDLVTGILRGVQAGHPHPLIQRANGDTEFIGVGGMPVGLIEGADYHPFEAQLSPGDRLLIQSDGIIECETPEGQFLEDDGLVQMMDDLRALKGMEFLEALIWKLTDFSRGQDFKDDVSAILLEFTG